MAKISLRAYNREIEELIEQGRRLDEAVAHCLHILRTYPKHLETYRLLGKAYLEAKRYDQAVDIFQRVLVAVPEDFVSHVGMSIIADDQAKLDEAIWHMERAFEVQPSNAAIQAELQRLFGRRDGVEPPKIRLTRGALAHMYVQGELYAQAISEIRAVIAHDANRNDMQVLLARAYARNGQKAEAAEVCQALLAISPYCLEANRLMAEGLAAPPDSDAAREYRRRVVELDPYAEFAQASISGTEGVAEGAIALQRLDYGGQPAETGVNLGIGLDAALAASAESDSPPPWLAPTGSEEPPTHSVSQAARANAVPDFMREAGWKPMNGGIGAETSELTDTSDAEDEASLGNLPEWVRALAPSDETDRRARAEAETVQTDDWLRESQAAGQATRTNSAQDDLMNSEDDTPNWLRDIAAGAEESPEPSPSQFLPADAAKTDSNAARDTEDGSGRQNDDGLAWLEGLAEKHGARAEELITPPDARPSDPPEWVGETRQARVAVPETTPPWMDGSGGSARDGSQKEDSRQVPPDEKPFDWMRGLSENDAYEAIEESPEPASEPGIGENIASQWPPNELDVGAGAAAGGVSGDHRSTVVGAPPPGREPSGEYESEVELPDWLAGLDREQLSTPTPDGRIDSPDELPEWLRAADEPPPVSTASEPRDWRPAHTDISSSAPVIMEAEAREIPTTDAAASIESPPASTPARGSPEPLPIPARMGPVPGDLSTVVPSLSAAKAQLSRGNIAASLEEYSRLIRRGRSLDEIIRDLRDALYRYPVEVPIWQALGDAYMRANRLQEALDAYTKAEELLR